MSFINSNNGNISPSFLGGKGFNINTFGDLLIKQLIFQNKKMMFLI